LPHPLRPSVAATFFQPTSTAYVALHDVGRGGPVDRGAVIGAAGAVGGQLVQQASRLGAQVVGFVGRPEQLAGVPGSGERHLLDEQTDGRLAAERPFTVLVDTLGGSELADRLRWIEPGGRAVVIGYVVGTSTTLDLPNWLFSDVALLPVNMIRAEPRAREISSTLVEMLHRGDLVLDVQEFGPDDIAAGLDALRQGLVKGRAAVRFAEDVGAAAGSGAPLGAGEASRP
jgi:NADPH:quinone reductase-like Zn-dependent oxidoreductase